LLYSNLLEPVEGFTETRAECRRMRRGLLAAAAHALRLGGTFVLRVGYEDFDQPWLRPASSDGIVSKSDQDYLDKYFGSPELHMGELKRSVEGVRGG
jgi:hypothetical protein